MEKEIPNYVRYFPLFMLLVLFLWFPVLYLAFIILGDSQFFLIIFVSYIGLSFGSIIIHQYWVKKYGIKTFDKQTEEYNKLLGID